MKSTEAAICNLAQLVDAIEEFAPEVVIHTAAQSVVLSAYKNPVETYSTNELGAVHMCEAIRRAGRGAVVVNVATDKCYQNQGRVWGCRENDQLGNRDADSTSKACSELVTQACRHS